MNSYRYFCSECGKTYRGVQLPTLMTCNCEPTKLISGTRIVTPLSAELLANVSTSVAATTRASYCTRWRIPNKSHTSHGTNFSSNQTLVNLINDIVTPVIGELRRSVRTAIMTDFGYDIDTGEMIY